MVACNHSIQTFTWLLRTAKCKKCIGNKKEKEGSLKSVSNVNINRATLLREKFATYPQSGQISKSNNLQLMAADNLCNCVTSAEQKSWSPEDKNIIAWIRGTCNVKFSIRQIRLKFNKISGLQFSTLFN